MMYFKFVRDILKQKKVWKNKLEEIIADSSEQDKVNLRILNTIKTGPGVSGIGVKYFGDIFNLKTNEEIIQVFGAFSFSCSYVDCLIDRTEIDSKSIEKILNEFYSLFSGQKTELPLIQPITPVVQYILKNISVEEANALLPCLFNYKETILREINSESNNKKYKERINTGKRCSDIAVHLLDYFSETKLLKNQKNAITNFFIATCLADDFADVYEDNISKSRSYVCKDEKINFKNISLQFLKSKKYFNKGVAQLDEYSQKNTFALFSNLTLLAYSNLFLEKVFLNFFGQLSKEYALIQNTYVDENIKRLEAM